MSLNDHVMSMYSLKYEQHYAPIVNYRYFFCKCTENVNIHIYLPFPVVRQALLQNQAPEIQAKLLALQKHMVQQKPPVSAVREVTSPPPTLPEVTKVESHAVDTLKAKPKPLTQEQKDEQSR